MVTISVLIATYNRAALLDECLTHLECQRFESGDEIIIVNNGSTDDTAAILARRQRTFRVPLGVIEESRPGKSWALSRAIAVAAGDVLAFTDDDVNVEAGWLDAIRRAMADPTVALIGGPVAPRWQHGAPAWLRAGADGYDRLAAPLALLDYGSEPTLLGARTAIGANLAVRRAVIAELGGFVPQLGKLRGTLLSGEDHELCQRVQAAGLKTSYCPSARVVHWVPASRTTLRYVLRWFFWSGITHAALEHGRPRGRTLFGIPAYLIRRFGAGVLGALAALGTGNRRKAVERTVDAAFAAGYAAARWGLVAVDRPTGVQPA
jgi:glucosyl-dolichyl phosphate glucuronosyltransferase